MTNQDLWKQYHEYTKDLTDNCRKLGVAAAALCWLFKVPPNIFPKPVMISLGFVVSFFIADMLQYFLSALIIRFWTRSQEKALWKENQTIDADYQMPAWLDYPAFTLWWTKICCLLLAYVFIGIQIFWS